MRFNCNIALKCKTKMLFSSVKELDRDIEQIEKDKNSNEKKKKKYDVCLIGLSR